MIVVVDQIPPVILYLGFKMWFFTYGDLYLLMVTLHVNSSAQAGFVVTPSLFIMVKVHVVE